METWEIIKELRKYPEKKFKCALGQIENFKGDIIWSTSVNKLVLNSITLNQEQKEICT